MVAGQDGPTSTRRTVVVDAAIETVFDVVSRPEHVARWWPDRADYEPVAGAAGTIAFGPTGDDVVETLTVVETTPPTRFAFRWKHPAGVAATPANSLLVVFELTPVGDRRTRLTMTESGYEHVDAGPAPSGDGLRERHEAGWAHFLPRLVAYAPTVRTRP